METPSQLRIRLGVSASLVLAVGSVGTVGYYLLWLKQGGTMMDAVFMTVITMTTIGYGEVQPLNHAGRWVTVFSVIGGVVVIQLSVRSLLSLTESGYFRQVRRRLLVQPVELLRPRQIPCRVRIVLQIIQVFFQRRPHRPRVLQKPLQIEYHSSCLCFTSS
mgnify:CR=1 FL=1